ncbi:MAG: family 43 glycosylhydrolase [Anaerolineales bacterium]
MTLQLSKDWIWDFWFDRDGNDYHIFYLKAPRQLEDAELRHWHVSIGHAVSQDLIDWSVLPDALRPSPSPAWDDCATWTGSVLHHKDMWYLFYTGVRCAEDKLIQRIGLATSPDLIHWKKYADNPIIEADPRWYELLDLQLWHDQAWRDPWVFQHPETGDFHALITGRVNYGAADQRGVIAHARSTDLIHWDVLPPITEPGEFGQMEVPQLVAMRDGYYLIFSCGAKYHAAQRQASLGMITGSYYLYAESPLGPFQHLSDVPLLGDKAGTFYSSKLIQGPDDKWYIMAFKNVDESGSFIGEITDPMPVQIAEDGRLSVEPTGEI